MVAEDVERLERQLRGETAKWVLLSVSNNCLYDHGVCKLVEVLQKTTAPLETLDLAHIDVEVGAKLATLLSADGDAPLLPLRKLLLGDAIGADGYAEVGAAIRRPRCSLEKFVVSTQMRERKTGQNRVSRTEEPNVVVKVARRAAHPASATPSRIISEVLALNTALRTIELRKDRGGGRHRGARARDWARRAADPRPPRGEPRLRQGRDGARRGPPPGEVPIGGARPLRQCDHVVGRVGAPPQGRRRVRGGAEEGGGGDACEPGVGVGARPAAGA